MPEVWIPTTMQSLTGGLQKVQIEGRTVRQVINNLEREFPGVKEILYDEEEDDLQTGIAVIVDGEASQIGLLERVQETSEVHFLPAIGGG
ncbi:MAG: MoaD/ThiS family protein [Chloroflexi bacterium]|nr:MoaD/ThiS family protein [Chloroflexota bacterium]